MSKNSAFQNSSGEASQKKWIPKKAANANQLVSSDMLQSEPVDSIEKSESIAKSSHFGAFERKRDLKTLELSRSTPKAPEIGGGWVPKFKYLDLVCSIKEKVIVRILTDEKNSTTILKLDMA
ncbi:hypothetical protein JRO89_XS06G0112000 [Xanthoceras sorbifolium]|uniref:Uncharacterized protein n=1 Tax=Xanthoceras sorbifolium TaxID=99658 RepID=A0ABQ8HXQ0_9ROSI|nr:hypothetical protein JRO89_XS06G0112000 [Xanthoceras sorbifolium]